MNNSSLKKSFLSEGCQEALLTGPLEETSALYAQAKLEGLFKTNEIFEKESKTFYGLIPATIYGPGDHFSVHSHVIPSLITRLTEAQIRGDKIFEVWGTEKAKREFIFSDDLADACLFLLEQKSCPFPYLNVGSGEEITIAELALQIAQLVKYKGKIVFNGKLEGVQRKILDSSKIRSLGWKPKVSTREGLERTVLEATHHLKALNFNLIPS